jgi:hypothetical protein
LTQRSVGRRDDVDAGVELLLAREKLTIQIFWQFARWQAGPTEAHCPPAPGLNNVDSRQDGLTGPH